MCSGGAVQKCTRLCKVSTCNVRERSPVNQSRIPESHGRGPVYKPSSALLSSPTIVISITLPEILTITNTTTFKMGESIPSPLHPSLLVSLPGIPHGGVIAGLLAPSYSRILHPWISILTMTTGPDHTCSCGSSCQCPAGACQCPVRPSLVSSQSQCTVG